MSKSKNKPAPTTAKPVAKPTAFPKSFSEKTPHWQLAVVFLLPLLVWSQTIGFNFSFHDDDEMCLDKAFVLDQGFRADNIFGTDAWMSKKQIELYRPFQTLTYIFDHKLGAPASPTPFHAHNWLIFSLNALLLFALLRRIFPTGQVAFWGAALFSVNFLFAHVVSWIPARGDLYLFTFSVLGLICLLDFIEKQSTARLIGSAVCFFFALLAKESAVALLPIFGLLVWQNRSKIKFSGAFWAWCGMLAVGLGWYLSMRKGAISNESVEFQVAAVFQNSRTIFEEFAKFLLPLKFCVMPAFDGMMTGVGLAIAAALGFLVWKNWGNVRHEIIWLGLALWLLPALPSLGYKPHFTGFAYDYLDHRAYFLSLGMWLVLLELARGAGFFEKTWAKTAVIGVGVYFAAFGFLFAKNYHDWRPFYENATTCNPKSGLAMSNMGTMLVKENKFEEALVWFEKAKAINPTDPDTRTRVADMLLRMNKFEECVKEATLGITPKNLTQSKALTLRGVAYGNLQKPELALADFQAAAKLNPDDPDNWRSIGASLKTLSRCPEAIEPLTRCIQIKPDYLAAYFDRGFCYGFVQKFAEAKADLNVVIKNDPKNGAAWFFRGRAEYSLGEKDLGCQDFKQAAALGIKEAEAFFQANCQ